MAFYENPEEMYKAWAKNSKKDADRHWAQGKNGEGDWHFGKAKKLYAEAEENKKRAKEAKGRKWK